MKLFVGGISAGLDEIDLKEMFELYGEVSFAQIIKDRATGKNKGFGFVEMPNKNEAKEAMDLLDGVGLFGKKISVKEAGEPPKTNSDSRWNSRDSTPRKRY
jgi:RNA recognition motif-containing protein